MSLFQLIRFIHPQVLWLLALLPILALWLGRKGAVPALGYSSTAAAREIATKSNSRFGALSHWLRLLALASVILALARPQFGKTTTQVSASGVDLMLAVDVSGSMSALDLKIDGKQTDRLEAVKSVVAKFIDNRPNDRIGLMAFSGAPYLVSPLTLDHDWLLTNLDRMHIGMMEDGTAIGSALAACTNRLRDQPGKSKVVILLTDGVNNTGKINPETAAEAAKALGVKVYTIGVGAVGEAPMPIKDARGVTHIEMVKADVDEGTLGAIATTTGGRFFRATDGGSLAAIYHDIDRMEKTTRNFTQHGDYHERYTAFAAAGLVFALLEIGASRRRLQRIP